MEAVVPRFKTQRSRTTLVRRGDIPKANGTERPLGMPALEDQVVQRAGAKRWTAIDAQDLLACRDGYRPGRGAWEAVRARTFDLPYGRDGDLREADIQGVFDHRDPTWLLDMWRRRIDDRALLHLSRQWLKAGIVDTDGPVVHPETGTPQGGTVSPVLANGYLH
jgi:RNA-directed DNA polymerase